MFVGIEEWADMFCWPVADRLRSFARFRRARVDRIFKFCGDVREVRLEFAGSGVSLWRI